MKAKASIALKVILGAVFIVSAILKVSDMDRFEIYIYSYHFFSLNFSFLVARAAIIAELVLGIGLVSNCFHKLMWWGSMAMLCGYTLLLGYALLQGRTDNCHCFGDFLQFNPAQSIVKNLLLMALFALVYKVKGWRFKGQWMALAGVVTAASVAVFVVSPPDNFTPAYHAEGNLQKAYFDAAIDEPPLDALGLKEGRQVVCFFSTGCEYCQMSAQKLSLMQQFYGFPADHVTYVFMGSEEGVAVFFGKSASAPYRYVLYDDVLGLLKITDGNFPVIVFLEQGRVVCEYGFRNMNEGEIKAFFEQTEKAPT